ncbi:hypothetical protein P7B02_18475 [Caulobacter segnis]|uniref:hypothetical protein n=1 Tax=Caulobacter segnis TaxID=88688 RepID=UPI00240EA340|nr:hypothetical protein [Caulobacter segnis]MDG2523518.1 hypothetical protein [Caulobacter segnis]
MKRLTGAAVLLALAAAVPAMANEAPITTRPAELPASAPAAAPAAEPVFKPMTTSEQIAGYLASSPEAADDGSPDEMLRRDLSRYLTPSARTQMDRQVHGEVSAMIGTGGARGAWGTVSMPVGETGTLTLSGGEGRNLYRAWPGYGYRPGFAGQFGGPFVGPLAGPYGGAYDRSFGLEYSSEAPPLSDH